MTKRNAELLLWDALRAAEEIGPFLGDIDLAGYLADRKTRASIERQFSIIGEAFAVLRREAPQIASSIDELPRIVGFRNTLIHGYAVIDHALVWEIAVVRVPPLVVQLRGILNRPGQR